MMCGALIGKKSLTPSPSPAERGVLETVRLSNTVCLSNQVMMSVSIRELQGVSRISLPSLWGRGKGEGLFVVVVCLVVLLLFYHCPFSVSNNAFDMASFASFVYLRSVKTCARVSLLLISTKCLFSFNCSFGV